MLINALRGHLAEFGIIAPAGHRRVGDLVARIQEGAEAGVPKLAREALLALTAELHAIVERIPTRGLGSGHDTMADTQA